MSAAARLAVERAIIALSDADEALALMLGGVRERIGIALASLARAPDTFAEDASDEGGNDG